MLRVRQPMDSSQRQDLQNCLNELLSLYKPAGDGASLRNGSSVTVDIYRFALVTRMKKLFPDMSDGQMIGYTSKASLKLINEPQENHTIERLIEIINSLLVSEGYTKITVTTFINIEYKSAPDQWNICGIDIVKGGPFSWKKFIEFDGIKSRLEDAIDLETMKRRFARFTPYHYDVFLPQYKLVDGIFHIHEEVVTPFEKLRSLLNYITCVDVESWSSSVAPLPQSPFVSSPFWFFEQGEKILDNWFYDMVTINSVYRKEDWKQSRITKMFDSLSLKLDMKNPEPNTFVTMLWSLLNLYQLALDATDDAVRFLHYWQVLERITSPQQMGRGIESNKIIERLSLLSTIPPLEKKVLKELGELRHNFAHVGEFPRDLGDHFVRMIKKFADRALYRLIQKTSDFSSQQDLEVFYTLAPQRRTTIESYEKILKYLQKV